ncbi:high mobility group protein [Niveomyces insectorum RCEF 264]|uniref:High mobility group protein n=1 Tax=Niveomyces insectorum RCEF 264 TaxID=1081102 RepID=A0A167X7T8_9HYPO|nr:high mobility group protein [Niveomyces insectorum RCEF 264]
MPPKAVFDAADATTRPAQEEAAKVTKPGKGSGKRGRPKMDPSLRKSQVYVPTGRPRGRPPKSAAQKKATAASKPASGAGRGRGRPAGSGSKKAAGGRYSNAQLCGCDAHKATLEAERLEHEALAARAEAAEDEDEDDDDEENEDSDANANGVDNDDDESIDGSE